MAQEDQTHNSAGGDGSLGFGIIGSSSGKSSNRKSKQRRAPQRGLGVAQLEKIRLEEQQKKNAPAIFSPPSSLSPAKTSSKLSVSAPNLHPIKQSSSSIPPLTSISPASFSPSTFVFRSSLPSHNIDDTNTSNNTPLVLLNNGGGFETEWSDMSVLGQREVIKPWNALEFDLQKDNSVFDSNSAFRSNFGLANESNLDWPSTGLVQKEQQHQLSSSAGMDVSSSSSLLNFLTEPPSNQSYYGNYTTVWPEMFGMKRPYAFSMDNSAGPSVNCRPPMAAPMRSDESTSCSNVSLYSYPFLGEGPSCSSSSSEPKSKKKMRGNAFKGDLLTLATPTTTWMCQSSKLKHLSAQAVETNHEFADLVSLPFRVGKTAKKINISICSVGVSLCILIILAVYIDLLKGGMEIPTCPHPKPSWSNQLRLYYRFFPPETAQSGQPSPKTLSRFNVEDESLDLNLKL